MIDKFGNLTPESILRRSKSINLEWHILIEFYSILKLLIFFFFFLIHCECWNVSNVCVQRVKQLCNDILICYDKFKQITSIEFLPWSIFFFSHPDEVFGPMTLKTFVPPFFTCRSSKQLEWRNLHAGLNRLHRMVFVRQRDISHYGKMALCPRFRASRMGELFQGATAERGFWNMSRSCARKVLCTHTFDPSLVHNRRGARLCITHTFYSYGYRHRVWLWHFNRRVEIPYM